MKSPAIPLSVAFGVASVVVAFAQTNDPVMQLRASFSEDKLVENIKAFADAVNKAKPAGAKGHYINRVSLSSTMGPGVKVDMATLGMSTGGSQH